MILDSPSTRRSSASIAQYALPQARHRGAVALVLWLLIIGSIIAVLWRVEALQFLGWVFVSWTIAASFWMFLLLPQNELRALRARGIEYSINARQHPRLKTLLAKGSAMVGVREPEGYLRKSDGKRGDYSIRIAGAAPHWLVVGQRATQDYHPPELDCLALRCLVHGQLGHVARLDMLQRLQSMTVFGRFLVTPIALYGFLLRSLWQAHAEQNADRLTLLLVKNPRLLLSALTKDFSAGHAMLRARGVSFEDVEAYLKDGGLKNHTGEETPDHQILSNVLHSDATFMTRTQGLTQWVNSPEYVLALESLAER